MTEYNEYYYAEKLAKLISIETVSEFSQKDKSKFRIFQDALRESFPALFSVCDFEDFDGSFILRCKGKESKDPIMLMNHHDVVEASGDWSHPPFSGAIADGKVWGRGTLDTKSGLFAMLQAGEELISNGYLPDHDIYFVSSCTEECGGEGADIISQTLAERGIRFKLVLDEGGMIITEPIAGAKGNFAMIGVGEKGCTDIKFTARSKGGHASTPPKNTPLVRLGKFMAAAERSEIFSAALTPTHIEMFSRISSGMTGVLKFVLSHAKFFKAILLKIMPKISSSANAMLKTTVAFTVSGASAMSNVLPSEAYVIGNMRFSHHQGEDGSVEAIKRLAAKFDVEATVIDHGFSSPISDFNSEAFRSLENAVLNIFPDAKTVPYILMGASDCRYMSRISDNCFRFSPFTITNEQLDSIHGVNEFVSVSALPDAVRFYKYIITHTSAE